MNKKFVLALSYLVLCVHFIIASTKGNQDEFNGGKVVRDSFLQKNISRRQSSPCAGDECFCQSYYDLTLILDESGSIRKSNWVEYVVPFTEQIVKGLKIGENDIHVGILLFALRNRDYITFDNDIRYKKTELLKKVNDLNDDYRAGGDTYILEALKYSLKKYSMNKNARDDAPKVTILFTDGNDIHASKSEFHKMYSEYQEKHVKLLVLGVSAAEESKLKVIAGCENHSSCPSAMKAEWETINNITNKLTNKICDTESESNIIPEPSQPIPCNGDDCFCKDYYDLTLILDDSVSITLYKWKKDVIPFSEKLINNLNISKDKVHVGIMRFSKEVITDVDYSQDTRYIKNDLISVVKGLNKKYRYGSRTNIVDALDYSLKNFTRHPNSRQNAPKVTILFTDGNDTSKTLAEERNMGILYRHEQVRLILVGVGQASSIDLYALADCEYGKNCSQVIECKWNELTGITTIITDKICDIESGEIPNPPETPGSSVVTNPDNVASCQNDEDCYCKDFYDVTLILDESSSIGEFRWTMEVIPFAKDVINNLNIDYDSVHVGVLLFSHYALDLVPFSDEARYNKYTLIKKIDSLKTNYGNGHESFIVKTLKYALSNYTKGSGRTNAPKITMLFTDGNDSSESDIDMYNIGSLYRTERVKLLVIGVSMASENKLKQLVGCAQNLPCPFVIKTEWGTLDALSKVFVDKICDTGSILPPESNKPEPEAPTPPCIGNDCFCHDIYDLTVILDESGSIGAYNWEKQVYPFTEKFLNNLEISENKVHVGIMLFAQFNRDFVKFSDKESYDKENLMKQIKGLKESYKSGGYTYIIEALNYGLANYTHHEASRSDVPKVTMLFTDGNNTNPGDKLLSDVSLLYKQENVKLLVVGVGASTMANLRLLAGCHKTDGNCPLATKTEWDNLQDISKLMADKICNAETPEIEEPESTCLGDECLCEDYFDLTFVAVPSSSKDYKKRSGLIRYAKNIINMFNIGKKNVHVSISIYLGTKSINRDFDDAIAYDRTGLLRVLDQMDNYFSEDKTNISEALEIGLNQTFGNGNREKAPKIALLLTDSNNDTYEKSRLENISKNYTDKGVKLLVIGKVDLSKEILFVAGGCDINNDTCSNVLIYNSFINDNSIENFIGENICDNSSVSGNGNGSGESGGSPLPPSIQCTDELCEECDDDVCDNNPSCKKAMDIVIALDQSRGITNLQWTTYVKPFMVYTVKENYLSKNRSHVTIVKMKANRGKEQWSLYRKLSYKKNRILKKIDKLQMSYSNIINLADNLKYIRTKTFNKTPAYKKKLIIMLVEGKSNSDLNELRKEIELLKLNKITLYVYAIDNIDEKEYKILGDCEISSSICENIVKVSWENLLSSVEIHNKFICNKYPEDAECSEWGEWSACPQLSCDRAISKRERKRPYYTIKEEGYSGTEYGNSCMDLGSIEYRACPVKDECNDVCGDFGEWSQCSTSCGDGIRIRTRNVSPDNEMCQTFNKTEIEPCNIQSCGSTEICEDIGNWSEWSACSKTCGYSIRERKFTIFPESIDEHSYCEHFEKIETEVCSVPKCENEECFDWDDWSEWSAPCGPRKRVQRARLYKNRSESSSTIPRPNSGKNDNCEDFYQDKIEYDEESSCPDNSCGSWTEWSECDRPCNVGMRIRHFITNIVGFNEGNDDECLENYNKIETEPCLNLPICNSGECNDWETWVDCKTDKDAYTCHVPNKRILTRKLDLLKNPKTDTSQACNDYSLFREEDCPTGNTPCVDALCNEWDEWGSCSETCGLDSFRIRKRKEPLELIPASSDINGNIGLTCEEQNIRIEEKEACNVPACVPPVLDGSNNGENSEGDSSEGFGTGEKISMAAGIIGLVGLAAGGLIYGYNTLNGGETPHNSNMEFENVENNDGIIEEENEDFEVIDANDPMWN
ncbi:circumsporozoite-and TRAP-related protein [Plasmodium berghei]|uniref:Circumsporozoite- and TRAP-related protein n=2 Tax=Plasmodium berghei TaxID=5821 RepID=A0A509AE84_PLABA|nr:circumsporozoite- and TRAP-related protein [Plasmodium berghei ANKA]SCL92083.1 circumsporozoite-and TRAP-related protein [Plasmodium berghei]SCM15590.1 circumsporozoite-and TRAP-related protein [Plasmodium berghei]SCM17382.1 circumsporozoite-and TRAP-related protein [Plasmodium berghei]SCN22636.1 circumsporozoite-and TRAP-related protein [Plasmodium berghei]VUC54355.1 circumsporozoite- and TRAP-related protein [Plasmodium berghei ANKA]|eukprot:XP_034420188.1 circumsporozoite- and TRAP-related protein [Plasmodium berghei ANKA]